MCKSQFIKFIWPVVIGVFGWFSYDLVSSFVQLTICTNIELSVVANDYDINEHLIGYTISTILVLKNIFTFR